MIEKERDGEAARVCGSDEKKGWVWVSTREKE